MHPILDKLEQMADSRPDRMAACDESLQLDYGRFRDLAAGLGRSISSRSERPRVGLLAPTSTAGALAIFACWYARRTPTPLNFLLSPDELRRVVADAELDLVVAAGPLLPQAEALGLRVLPLDAASLQPADAAAPRVAESDTAVVLYTSGTSSEPKGVCLGFGNIAQNAAACAEHARMTPDQVFLSVLPQFHSFGFTAMTVTPLMLGAQVWFLPRFRAATVLDAVREQRVTIFMAVASLYGALARTRGAAADALASLKLAISGGEPLPSNVAAGFRQAFGVEICEGYGLTETSPVVSINTPWAHRAGSVGRVIPGVEVFAVDERRRRAPVGAEGELAVRGHCVMQGYLNKPAETRETLADGTLYTGDLGVVDADGFVHVTGRVKDLIIVAGENVLPIEIERVLVEHPQVAEAAVVGVADGTRGEKPIAFITARGGAAPAATELREFCRARLAGYKVPRDVFVVETLPRGPTGKVLKRALRPPAAARPA